MARYVVYTYQFSPIKSSQTNMFETPIDFDKLMAEKQDIFESLLIEPDLKFIYRSKHYHHQIVFHSEHVFVIKLANSKLINVEKNFQKQRLENNPSCYVIIDNRHDSQQIAIEENTAIFTDIEVVQKILAATFERHLSHNHLSIQINKRFQQSEFWNTIQRYSNGITMVRFQFSYPNLPRVSETIDQMISNASRATNSKQTTFEFKSDSDNLTLDSESDMLNGMVKASADSGCPITLKARGLRSYIKTGTTSMHIEIEEVDSVISPDLLQTGLSKLLAELNKTLE